MNTHYFEGFINFKIQQKVKERFFKLLDKGYSTRKAKRQIEREIKQGKLRVA